MISDAAREPVVQKLEQYLLRKPFAPFRMVLSGGEVLNVVRPFQVGVGLTRFRYAAPDSDRTTEQRLDEIASLEDLSARV
jgi:hypothetical protein